MAPSVSSTRQASGRALLSLSKGAPAHAQHQDLMTVASLGLIKDQGQRIPGFRQPGQDLAGEWLHDFIATYQGTPFGVRRRQQATGLRLVTINHNRAIL